MIDYDLFAPVILDLIDEAEERLDNGSDRHQWVVDQAMERIPMPRYIPRPVQRAIMGWLVEMLFQLAVKGLGHLAERIAKKAAAPSVSKDGSNATAVSGSAPKPVNLEHVMKRGARKLAREVADGEHDTRLGAMETAEMGGKGRQMVLKSIRERMAGLAG